MAQPSDLIGQMLSAGAQNDPMRGFITAAQAADALITSRQNRKAQLEELELQHGKLTLDALNSDRNYEIDKEKLGIELAKSNREAELMSLTKRTMEAQAMHQMVSSEVMKANLMLQSSNMAREDMLMNQMLVENGENPWPIRGVLDPLVVANMGNSLYDAQKVMKPGSSTLSVPSIQEAEAHFNYTSTLEVAQNAHANADWMEAEADKIASPYKPLQDAIPRRRTEAKIKRAMAETKRKEKEIGEGKYASMSATEVMAEAMKLAEVERAGEYKGLENAGGSEKLMALAQQKDQAEKAGNPEAEKLEKEAENLDKEAVELEGRIDTDAVKRAEDMRANAKRLREESTKEVATASTSIVDATAETFFKDSQRAEIKASMMKQQMPNTNPDTVDSMVKINLYNRGVEAANVIKEHGGDVKEVNKRNIEKLFPGLFSTATGKELEVTVPSDRLIPVTAIESWRADGMKSMSPELTAAQMVAKMEATTTPIKMYDGRTVLKKTTELDKVEMGEDVRTGETVAWNSSKEVTQTQSKEFTKAKGILNQIELIENEVKNNPALLKDANVLTKWKRQISDQLGIKISDAELKTATWGTLVAIQVQNIYSGQASTDVEGTKYKNLLGATTDTSMGFASLKLFGDQMRADMVTNYEFQAQRGVFVPPAGLHPSAIPLIKQGHNQVISDKGFKPIPVGGSDLIPKDPANASIIQSYIDNAKGETDRAKALEWINKAKELSIVTKRATQATP
jgi:hypothetical protein